MSFLILWFMQMEMVRGYHKAVVAFPHHRGTYDSPNPPLLFSCISHGGAGGCRCGQSLRVGPSMGIVLSLYRNFEYGYGLWDSFLRCNFDFII